MRKLNQSSSRMWLWRLAAGRCRSVSLRAFRHRPLNRLHRQMGEYSDGLRSAPAQSWLAASQSFFSSSAWESSAVPGSVQCMRQAGTNRQRTLGEGKRLENSRLAGAEGFPGA